MQLASWRPMARVLAERDLWQTRCVREFKFFQVFKTCDFTDFVAVQEEGFQLDEMGDVFNFADLIGA